MAPQSAARGPGRFLGGRPTAGLGGVGVGANMSRRLLFLFASAPPAAQGLGLRECDISGRGDRGVRHFREWPIPDEVTYAD